MSTDCENIPLLAEGYVAEADDREIIDPEFSDSEPDAPDKPEPVTGIDAWEGLVEMPKKTYTLKRGNFQITLTEPEDYKAIESAYSAPDDADKLALAISTQARVRIKGEVVNAIRMIRTCCPKDARPSEATLARISVKHPGTFNQLAMAAMELCGLMNVDAVKDAAAEAFLP